MKCPNCNETLLMTERQNVEIDYCPNCRGVWLDKGELDKLLEQVSHQNQANTIPGNIRSNQDAFEKRQEGYRDERREDYSNDPRYHQKSHKKKSFLSDFFDFD